MNRIYHNHNLWEDWKQGLYDSHCDNEEIIINNCVFLLSTQTVFDHYARKVIEKWPYSCEHNLTDNQRNKNAYLGQITCCYYCGAPEYITKIAWNRISKKIQDSANRTAEKIIKEFIKRLENKNQLKLI